MKRKRHRRYVMDLSDLPCPKTPFLKDKRFIFGTFVIGALLTLATVGVELSGSLLEAISFITIGVITNSAIKEASVARGNAAALAKTQAPVE